MEHVATVNAYELKSGGFRGVALVDGVRHASELFDTLSAATYWAKQKAWDLCGPVRYAPLRRRGEYLANCWK